MEKKDFSKITQEEAMRIMIEFKSKGGCQGSECSTCLMKPENYDNAPDVSCNGALMHAFRKIAGIDPGDTDETIETISITPETTNMNFLVDSGYVHVISAVLTDENKSKICKSNNCCNCKLGPVNFSDELKIFECGERIRYLQNVSIFLKQYGSTPEKKVKNKNVCANCQYCNDVGDYKFCNAWRNYTAEDMHCGYYKKVNESIDK